MPFLGSRWFLSLLSIQVVDSEVAMSQFPDDVARHFAEERFAALRAALPRRAAVERRLLRALEKDTRHEKSERNAAPRCRLSERELS